MKKILAEILVEALLLLEMFAIIQAFSPKYVSVLDRGYPMPDLKIRDALVTNLASGVVRSLAPSNSEIHPSFRGLDTKTSLGSETYLIEKARRQECGYCRTNMTRGMAGEIQSPNFPGRYGANVDCLWLLEGLPGTRVKLTCDTIHLESCGVAGPLAPNWRDILIVSPMWTFKKSWVYCGRATKGIKAVTNTSICNRMAVTFRSNDNQLQYMGFHCSYQVV